MKEKGSSVAYQMCAKTVMDTTDPDIIFDREGISNHWYEFQEKKKKLLPPEQASKALAKLVAEIREEGKNNRYDCLIGISGGLDSSYLTYLASELGLRPLIVHFDNGWNSELAVHNIEGLVRKLNFDLYTFVMDWNEFRDVQRAYFKASVLDLEVPTDHMIFGALYKIAREQKIKTILNGSNVVTEGILPEKWKYTKTDYINLRNIHKKFGELTIKKLPKLGILDLAVYTRIHKLRSIDLLNYCEYDVKQAKQILGDKFGWRDYGGKHFESVFTRFYQGYILPHKFNIDKRKAHYSTLICSGQMTRPEALDALKLPHYDPILQEEDKIYVAKKLGFTTDEFEQILTMPGKPHEVYGTDKKIREMLFKINRWFR